MNTIGGDVGLVTVVFVDVEGSTALIDRVGDVAGMKRSVVSSERPETESTPTAVGR